MNDLHQLYGEQVFPNPDRVGDSQYRAIYDTIEGALEDCKSTDREALIRTILGEFKEWSETLLRQMVTEARLDREEFNTVLAALRYYQHQGMADPAKRPDWLQEIACPAADDTSLDDVAIDTLCERLNFGSVAVESDEEPDMAEVKDPLSDPVAREDQPETGYRVRIEIDVDARDAVHAAQAAYQLLRARDCTPWACEVFAGGDTSRSPVAVDLGQVGTEAIETDTHPKG